MVNITNLFGKKAIKRGFSSSEGYYVVKAVTENNEIKEEKILLKTKSQEDAINFFLHEIAIDCSNQLVNEKEEENKKQWHFNVEYTKDKFRYEYTILYLNRVYDNTRIEKMINLYTKKMNENQVEPHWVYNKEAMQFEEINTQMISNDEKKQYLKIKDLSFDIESTNISLKNRESNHVLFVELRATRKSIDGETWHPYLYINNGIPIKENDIESIIGKSFEYDYDTDNSQTWIMYVFGHENIKKGKIEILSKEDNKLRLKWCGEADIFFNEDYDERVPFESEFEVEINQAIEQKSNLIEQKKDDLAKDFLSIILENYFKRKNIGNDDRNLYRIFLPKIDICCSKEELLNGSKNLVISFPIYKFEKENSYRIFSWIDYYLDRRLIDKFISLDENNISEDVNFFDHQNNKELFDHFKDIFKIFIGLVMNEFDAKQYNEKLTEMYNLICNYEKEISQLGKGEFITKTEKEKKNAERQRKNQELYNENIANQKLIDEKGFREFVLTKMGEWKLPKEHTDEEEREYTSQKCSDMIELIKKYSLSFIDIEYQLSKRQKAVMEATENMIIDRLVDNKNYIKYQDIYWEIWDFVDDYGDRHNQKITCEEYDIILKLLTNLMKCCNRSNN